MHKKTEVYAYIMEQIDKLLAQGIEYYQDKDDAIENNLLDIKKYLKTFDVLVDDAKETPKKSLKFSRFFILLCRLHRFLCRIYLYISKYFFI